MTGPMHAIADAIPSTVPAITDPWLGLSRFSVQLPALVAWAAAAILATIWLSRRVER